MTFVVQGFPGNPVNTSGFAAGAAAALTTAFPAAPAGSRQYLMGFLVSLDPGAIANTTLSLTGLTNGAGGSNPAWRISTQTATTNILSVLFPRPLPANAQASAIALVATADVTFGQNISVALFGYNVPE